MKYGNIYWKTDIPKGIIQTTFIFANKFAINVSGAQQPFSVKHMMLNGRYFLHHQLVVPGKQHRAQLVCWGVCWSSETSPPSLLPWPFSKTQGWQVPFVRLEFLRYHKYIAATAAAALSLLLFSQWDPSDTTALVGYYLQPGWFSGFQQGCFCEYMFCGTGMPVDVCTS